MMLSTVTVVVAWLTLGANAQAADVAVFPVTAINLSPGEAEAIGTLVAQAYGRVAGVEVLLPQVTGAARTEGRSLAETAAVLGVREYLELAAIGLLSTGRRTSDERIILEASRHQADGTVIYKAEMAAMSLGDLEVVADRLARSLYEKKAPAATLGIHSVSGKEGAPENRTFVEKVIGMKTSAAFPFAQGQRYDPMIAFGFDSRLEAKNYFLEFGAGLVVPTDSSTQAVGYGGVYGELGGSYYLSDDSVSPYVGGGVLPRLIFGGGANGANMALYGQMGLMFARESSTRLYADVRVAQNIVPLHRDVGGYADGTLYTQPRRRDFYPTEIGLEFGIGW